MQQAIQIRLAVTRLVGEHLDALEAELIELRRIAGRQLFDVSLAANSATILPEPSINRVTGGWSCVCATSTKYLPSGETVTM